MPHRLYYEFVRKAFFKQQGLFSSEKRIRSQGAKNLTEKDKEVLLERRMALNDVLVYCALALEAYINYYAMKYDVPFHRDFERGLSTVNKFKVYTQLKTRRCLDGRTTKIIKDILGHRDEIVHPKPERIKAGFKGLPKPKSMQGKVEKMDLGKLIIDLNHVFKAVFEIDENEKEIYDQDPWLCELKPFPPEKE